MLDLRKSSSLRETVTGNVEGHGFDVVTSFNNAIFGPNTTIVIGNNKIRSITNRNTATDFQTLAALLKTFGVDETAIKQLQQAINDELSEKKHPSLTGRIGTWLAEQISRSAAGAFALGVDKFAPAVIDAVKSHLGL